MEYNKLSKKVILSWRIGRLIGIVIFGILLLIGMAVLLNVDVSQRVVRYAGIGGAAFILYLIIALFLYPVIEYRQWGYIISDDRVEIRKGIFFIQTMVIPIVRIQHVVMSQGPINRKLGLSCVEIHTASGEFKIEGLENDVAREITENMKNRLNKRLSIAEKG